MDNWLQGDVSKLKLKALETMFNNGIPFNTPHKFKFTQITNQKTLITLPFIRKNKNHLGGIHACAVATLGEYPAGLSIIKRFGASRYRIIMKRIQVEYFKQAKEELVGEVIINQKEFDEVEKKLTTEDQVDIVMTTNILNGSDEVISVVHTTWQLKNWTKVSFNRI